MWPAVQNAYTYCLPHVLTLQCTLRDSQLNQMPLGLYRIYFFPIPPEPDLSLHIRPEPELDFQIDCNFTNLMCKTLRMHKWFEFLIIFCAAVTVTTFLISGFLTYLGLLDSLTTVPSYLMSGKNRLFKSSKTIWLRWDFCRRRISARFEKSAVFRPEPKSGTALDTTLCLYHSKFIAWVWSVIDLKCFSLICYSIWDCNYSEHNTAA